MHREITHAKNQTNSTELKTLIAAAQIRAVGKLSGNDEITFLFSVDNARETSFQYECEMQWPYAKITPTRNLTQDRTSRFFPSIEYHSA